MEKKLNSSSQSNLIVKFTLSMSLIVLLFILSIFTGILVNNRKILESEILSRARSYFENIVLTRKWNAKYGGVFIEKTEGVESNPYLKNPDIETLDRKIYTKKNPALMTREISELADDENLYQFHITSLKPLNPNNIADEFETLALLSFDQGYEETYLKEKIGDNVFFRYMGPLETEESCIQCHGEQGYKIGDIRGGISVIFNIDDIERNIVTNRIIMVIISILSTLLLLGVFYFLIFRLNRNLHNALTRIKTLAEQDSLTSLYNRRYMYEWAAIELSRATRYEEPLSIIMLDIDHFKKINDNYGHKLGDKTLIEFSRLLKKHCRKTDIVARYGGEEFVIILTNTEKAGAI
ncbi:MAG: diguanylate cyclase, partial [bacterium]|nr:diguanylate cyclase [bacterium]